MTHKEIAKIMHISTKTIWKVLRSYGEVSERQKNINHDFFSKVDNEQTAYYLGFVMADGGVCNKRNTLSITLQEKDSHILCHLNTLLNNVRPLEIRNNYKNNFYTRLTVNSKKLVADLALLGCVPRKTYTNSIFPTIPEVHLKHFIRGYFDGDGHISMHKYPNGKYIRTCFNFNILLQKNYVEFISNHLIKHLDIKINVYSKKECNNDLFILKTSSKKNIEQLYHYLYDDSTIFMQRKYDTWQSIISNISRIPQY